MFVSTNPKNNKVPKLRFTDFEGDWELCKLGELIESFDSERIPIDSSLRISGQYPYYGATGIIDYIDSYIFDGEYVLLAEDGANIIMRNYPVAYLTQGKFWLNNHAHIMRMVKGDNQFLVQILEKMNYSKYNTGTAQPKLNSNIVKRINLRVPIPEEQQKIGTIFKQLDDTITLHQRKLDQLKELKKAYLQLMFPKKDETVPRVRFADFEDDWQLCKLGDVVEIFDGTHQTPRYTDSGVKFVSVENIATLETKKYITHEAYEKEYSKKRAKKGDILMTRIGDIGTMKVIETDEPLAYYVTLALLKAKETNPYFLSFIISSPEIQRNIWKRTLHIAFPKKINLGEINQVEMKITIFEEQDKIGDLFTNLDDAIILNQNKLNQLKSLKKSYLQNMFI
ncbi:TPA: restriction endonuclease subunit S [Enterococcus faecalis]|nr:restriction endonuclease subunit S [Enterococcus faecalis]